MRNAKPVKLDIGCGPNPREGFEGVDQHSFSGKVKHVFDVRKRPWPWKDGQVEEVHCSHFVEHLTSQERTAFVNELYRVLKPGGKATIIAPHWASNRAYGDPTHQWPPVSEMWFYYLDRKWRLANAPHTDEGTAKAGGLACDFEVSWFYNVHSGLNGRAQEYLQHALAYFKESAQDTVATMTARK